MLKKITNPLPWLLFLALFLPLSLLAQEQKTAVVPVEKNAGQMKTVMRGTVVDESGLPLPGAKVQLVSRVPKFKVVTTAVTDAEEIKKNLIAQLTGSVKWTQSVQNMIKDGASSFVEIGPGKALQGMIKKIDASVEVSSVD